MEVDLTPTQVDLTATAEASKPPTPRNPTWPGSYLEKPNTYSYKTRQSKHRFGKRGVHVGGEC
eukprot:2610948-Amphidinium_carterae.1